LCDTISVENLIRNNVLWKFRRVFKNLERSSAAIMWAVDGVCESCSKWVAEIFIGIDR
jgi:hypothetical protein